MSRVVVGRDLLLRHVFELHAFEAARDAVEARYLEGAAADFPAARRAWAEQMHHSETAAILAMRAAELDGAQPPPPDDPVAFEARVAPLSADFVEPARPRTYNELGDGRRAQSIAAAWLKSNLLADGRSAP